VPDKLLALPGDVPFLLLRFRRLYPNRASCDAAFQVIVGLPGVAPDRGGM